MEMRSLHLDAAVMIENLRKKYGAQGFAICTPDGTAFVGDQMNALMTIYAMAAHGLPSVAINLGHVHPLHY
jgi:hypothetical protein